MGRRPKENKNWRDRPPATAEVNFVLHPQQGKVLESVATEILFGGSASGGKSHLARVLAILWCLEIPGIQIYFFRRLYDDLIKNHVEGPTGFRAMLAPWLNGHHPNSPLLAHRLAEMVEGEIRFWNGSKIFLCHLQHQKDITKYYGVEIHAAFVEEATQFSEFMMRFLRSRLRIPKALFIPERYCKPKGEWKSESEPDYYFPRVVYTSNPGGIGHSYIKKGFISGFKPLEYHRAPDSDGGHIRQYIPARVDHNPSVNREEVKANLAGLPPALVDALLNGNWDAVVGAYFPEFDPELHFVRPFSIPSHWTRIMSMDWGACGEGDPFAIGWWAVSDGSISLYPRGTLICYDLWYGKGLPKVTVDRVSEGILQREAGNPKVILRVAGGDILERRGTGPSIFEIFGSHGVHFARADMRRVSGWQQLRERLVGKDGVPRIFWFDSFLDQVETIMNLQHDINDPNDCAPGEDHVADSCLAGDTEIYTLSGVRRIKDLVGTAGFVMNHLGEWVPYENCKKYKEGEEMVRLVFADGAILSCTPDHKIMDAGGNWINAIDFTDKIRYFDKSWNQKLSPIQSKSLVAKDIIGAGFISADKGEGGGGRSGCIVGSGSILMVLSPKAFMSIIKTRTQQIIQLLTLYAYPQPSTFPAICEKRGGGGQVGNCVLKLDHWRRPGINQRLGGNGIGSIFTQMSLKKYLLRGIFAVFNVVRNFNLFKFGQNFVQISAKRNLDEFPAWTTLRAFVLSVKNLLLDQSMSRSGVAGESVVTSKVPTRGAVCLKVEKAKNDDSYCLDTPSPHSFITKHKIVVHNCRYMCMARPWTQEMPVEAKTFSEQFVEPKLADIWAFRDRMINRRDF
jgi:hypothetical protein